MKIRILQYLSVLCVACWFMSGVTDGGTTESSLMLRFQNKTFDPLKEKTATDVDPGGTVDDGRRIKVLGTPASLDDSAGKGASAPRTDVEKYYVLQFDGPVPGGLKDQLKTLGVHFFDYVPQYAFMVKLAVRQEDAVRAMEYVRWLGPYSPALRTSSSVYGAEYTDEEGNTTIRIIAFPGEDVRGLRSKIADAGGQVERESASDWDITFIVKIRTAAIQDVQKIEGVKWIEPIKKHRVSNNIAAKIVQSRNLLGDRYPPAGLLGNGQIVAVCDSGIDTGDAATLHEDFMDPEGAPRLIHNEVLTGATPEDESGHGTHVAGIVLGNGICSGGEPATHEYPPTCFAGAAPEAQLYFQSAGNGPGGGLPGIPSDLKTLFQSAYDTGARIHTNSWGSHGPGEYNYESVDVDRFMWRHKDFLILFAAGNTGTDNDGNGVIDRYSLDLPGTAKNCLTVGACESLSEAGPLAGDTWSRFGFLTEPFASDLIGDNPRALAVFSSRGPTLDGRYKPELVAPGTNILSTRSALMEGHGWAGYDEFYTYMGGTSMATPLAAGSAALVREYLIKERGLSPSAALVKTALIHGADDLDAGQYNHGAREETGPAPGIAQGWGRLDLRGTIDADSDSAFNIAYEDVTDAAPADTGYQRLFPFDACSGTAFKATLGWTDYPGSEAVSGGLVNDLDLRVRTPDGSYVYPDNPRNPGEMAMVFYGLGGTMVPRKEAQVWAMRVTAPDSTMALQDFLLAFSGNGSAVEGGAIAVYTCQDGEPADLLFRKEYARFPPGTMAFPLGIAAGYDELFVSIEKNADDVGLLCSNVNGEGRALIRQGESWQPADVSPVAGCLFRSVAADSGGFDRVNNTVSVTIPHPRTGTYTAEVTAHHIANGPQPYALVMSGLGHGLGNRPETNPIQPNPPVVTEFSSARDTLSCAEISETYGVSFKRVSGDVVSLSIQLADPAGPDVVSVRYPVSGLMEKTAGDLQLWGLLGRGKKRAFTYPSTKTYADGNWWLSRVSGAFVAPQEPLDRDETYFVVSVIGDQGDHDRNATAGNISAPQVMAAAFRGGGGCAVGAGNDYVTAVLVVLSVIFLCFRRVTGKLDKK